MTKLIIATILILGLQTKSSLPTIEINSVNKDILTIISIDCSKFEDSFDKNQMKKRRIVEKGQVTDLISELEKLKVQDRKDGPDTRAIITVKYSDRTERICADKFSIYRNGTRYEMTDKLKQLIWVKG